MSRKYTYHRENCDCFIREIIVDVYGRRIVLGGQHAFEYSITVISITGRPMANSLYVLTVVSLLMDMSVRIANTQKKDEMD